MGLLRRFKHLPKPLRSVLAWMLICSGFLLFITPFPGGIVLIAVGDMMLYRTFPSRRRQLSRRFFRSPKMTAYFAPMLTASDRSPRKKGAGPFGRKEKSQ